MKIPECRSKTIWFLTIFRHFWQLCHISFYIYIFFFCYNFSFCISFLCDTHNVTCYGCPGRATYRTHILLFLLKLYNYISRFCCVRVPLFSTRVLLGKAYMVGRSQQHRQKFSSCTSPIEHLYISQFPFVFRNVFVRRFSCHIFLFATVVGVATSVIIVVSCPLSLASPFFLFVFRWPFSHSALQMGHSGPFNAIRCPGFVASLTI